MSDVLRVDTLGQVRRLTLHRPDKHNALNHELSLALLNALLEADADPEVRVIILTGAGASFCAGADTAEFAALSMGDPQQVAERAALTTKLHGAFSRMGCPVVAAVRGYALGGGCGLALAADIALASESTVFGLPEIRHGIVPAVVMANLVRHVGRKAAFALVATGERIPAARALQLGLLNEVVPDGDLDVRAHAVADQLAAANPAALAATKRLFYRVADLTFEQGLDAGRDANVIMRSYREQGDR